MEIMMVASGFIWW